MGRAILGLIAAVAALGAIAPAAQASLSVPTGGTPLTFTGTGTSGPSGVPNALASFEAATRGADNRTATGDQGSGFRHINWDGIALDGSDPGSTVIKPRHVVVVSRSRLDPWGLEVGVEPPGAGSGSQVAVANDGFVSVNGNVAGRFSPFSSPNVWAPFNSHIADFGIVTPAGSDGTPTAAVTRGLGVVFLNVRTSDTTIQYYNGEALLGQVTSPSSLTPGATSFAGLLFPNAVVTRVVITLGTATIFSSTAVDSPPASNLVAAADVALAEPAPARPAVAGTVGVPVSPVLDTFTESDANATVTSVIDWGDGTRSPGTIVPAAGGAANVTGTHTYASSGSYTARVTVDDGSSEQSTQTDIRVVTRPTVTTVTCSPSPVAVSTAALCTAIVSDLAAGTPSSPTGVVSFGSPTAGAQFAAGAGCILGPTGATGISLCEIQFIASRRPPNQARIEAAYSGDSAHTGSGATATVGVGPLRCSMRTLTRRLRPGGLGVLVTCDARANVEIAVKALGGRKGPFARFQLPFGTFRSEVPAGRPTVLVLKPGSAIFRTLRTALRRHQHVSLKLTLTAGSRVMSRTTTTRVQALRSP